MPDNDLKLVHLSMMRRSIPRAIYSKTEVNNPV